MNFKKQRGTAIIEYVIILAFICGIGASFTSDGLTKPINSIISKVAAILDLDFDNGGGNLLAKSDGLPGMAFQGGERPFGKWTGTVAIKGMDQLLMELNPKTDYEITVDLEALRNNNLDPDKFGVALFIWSENNSDPAASFNTGGIFASQTKEEYGNKNNGAASGQYGGSTAKKILSDDGKTMTITFQTQDSAYFGMNLEYGESSKLDSISKNYQNYISLKAVPKSTT